MVSRIACGPVATRRSLTLILLSLIAFGQVVPARAQEPNNDLLAFGRQLADLIAADDIGTVADLFIEQTITCPAAEDLFRPRACADVSGGTEVSGYPTGLLDGNAALLTRTELEISLEALAAAFRSDDVRLYATAEQGTSSGFLACETCAALVVSTPVDAAIGDDLAFAGYFHVAETEDGFRLHSFSQGLLYGENIALISGGTVAGQEFERVQQDEPPPTATATPPPTEIETETATPTSEVTATEPATIEETPGGSPTATEPTSPVSSDGDDDDLPLWIALAVLGTALAISTTFAVWGWVRSPSPTEGFGPDQPHRRGGVDEEGF